MEDVLGASPGTLHAQPSRQPTGVATVAHQIRGSRAQARLRGVDKPVRFSSNPAVASPTDEHSHGREYDAATSTAATLIAGVAAHPLLAPEQITMSSRFLVLNAILCALLQMVSSISRAQAPTFVNPAEQEVVAATNVLIQTNSMPTGIPKSLMSEAQAIAIVPNMVRGAFVIGLQHGRGVLVTRGPQGAWQPPRMIQIAGGSLGYQVGVQSTDLILVFRTPQSVANLMKGTLKVGVDASAAAGPVGRQGSAATDLRLQAEILSYSRARGAFVGVSIDGSAITLDPAADQAYYQPPGTVP